MTQRFRLSADKRVDPLSTQTDDDLQTGSISPHNFAGRPSSYRKEYDDEAFRLTLLGLNSKELASFFQINEVTLFNWMKAQPSFFKSIQEAKAPADGKVAASLYKRAMGMTVEHEKVVMVFDPDLGEKVPQVVKYSEYVPPDVTAANRWLGNRQRGRWVDNSAGGADGKSGEGTLTVVVKGGLPDLSA